MNAQVDLNGTLATINSNNLDLWREVFITDPAAVKPITGKSYKGSSPKPYWIVEQATKHFGPCGIGWGVEVLSESYINCGPKDVIHSAVVKVWYVWNGVRGEVQQVGGTKVAYETATGKYMVDEDAAKKSVTDGMIKCLSMIGFAGDIFSGRWDDSKYHQEQEERKQQQQGQRQQQNAQQRQGQGQQRQGQQQNAQQAQGQQQRPIAQHASQMTPEGQANALRKALNRINNTTDAEDLNASIKFFAGTEHEQTVRNACNAKADREGWVNG